MSYHGQGQAPGSRCRSVILPGDYAYSSIWPAGRYQGLPGRRRAGDGGGQQVSFPVVCEVVVVAHEAVDDGVGVSGLMLSIVSISICLNLQLLIVCVGSLADILERIFDRRRPQAWIWLSTGWLCENQPVITGLY